MSKAKNDRRELKPAEKQILFAEVDGLCPLCKSVLHYEKKTKKGKYIGVGFEAAHIYPLNPTEEELEILKEVVPPDDLNDLSNFLALGEDCHKKFDTPRTLEEYYQLKELKQRALTRNNARAIISEYKLEEEIKDVIASLASNAPSENLQELSYEAMKINDKVNATLFPITKEQIQDHVKKYYLYIKTLLNLEEQKGLGTGTLITIQVKAYYKALLKTTANQEEIYQSMIEWVQAKSGSKATAACAIIVAFFIQNCEVFDVSAV